MGQGENNAKAGKNLLFYLLTCHWISVGKAVIINSIQGQEMIQKLFPFLLTAQEGRPLVLGLEECSVGAQCFQVTREQLLLEGEPHPSSSIANFCFYIRHRLDVSERKYKINIAIFNSLLMLAIHLVNVRNTEVSCV